MANSRICASYEINTGARGSNNGARSIVSGVNVGVLDTKVPPEAIINKVLVKAVSKTVKGDRNHNISGFGVFQQKKV